MLNVCLQDNVHELTAELLDLQLATGVFPPGPLHNDLILFERTGIGGPREDYFVVDWREINTPWNKQLSNVFSDIYTSQDWYADDDEDEIKRMFLAYLRTLISKYCEARNGGLISPSKRKNQVASARNRRVSSVRVMVK